MFNATDLSAAKSNLQAAYPQVPAVLSSIVDRGNVIIRR